MFSSFLVKPVVPITTLFFCFAAILRIDTNTHYVRGINISANHVKSVSDGFVYAAAKSVHSGRTTQTFDIEVTNQKGELISTCRLTTITLPK